MQRILLGTTQEIVSYPRLSPDGLVTGVPSSVTARRVPTVYEDGVDEYQAVTVDALSTTLSAVALEGDESLTLAGSVTVVAGRRYLVTDANTLRKIEVTPTNSGSVSTLYLSEPLPCGVANGSALNGIGGPVPLAIMSRGWESTPTRLARHERLVPPAATIPWSVRKRASCRRCARSPAAKARRSYTKPSARTR